MRHLASFLLALSVPLTAAAVTPMTPAPRLTLALTTPLGATDGSQCLSAAAPANDASGTTTVTERNVIHWNPVGARWTLDPARFPEADDGKLTERCFVLSVDGKVVSSGVSLSVNTSRLTGYPTLNVIPRDGVLTLQLTSGNHRNIGLLHAALLEDVFGNPTHLAQQLQKIRNGDYIGAGDRWAAAIRALIARKAIRPGTPVEEALALLGPPNSKQAIAGGQMMVWYFDTPAHVNPTFIVYTEGEFVSSYRLDRR